MESLSTSVTLQGEIGFNNERPRQQNQLKARLHHIPILRLSALSMGWQVELLTVFNGSFSIRGVFCFGLCFGAKRVELRLSTLNIYMIRFPPRYSMKQSSLLGASLKEGSPLY